MIGRLTGSIAECSPDRVLLDVSGVGYAVRIPLSTYYVVSNGNGRTCSLHVYTHVREDTLQLFGFATQDERATFELLISISGIGPRTALAILSGIGVDELRQAVSARDRVRLEKIPGVGRRTAERMLLELEHRLSRAAPARTPAPGHAPRTPARARDFEDACSALANLGYAMPAAERAVREASDELGPDVALAALLKGALAHLAR
jgi:Holliday junction DNA helicase RuvA